MLRQKNLWIIHILSWLLFLTLPVTIMSREPDPHIYTTLLTSVSLWLFVTLYAAIFYSNLLFLIPQLFLRKRYAIYAGVFFAGFFAIFYTQPFEKLIFQKFHESESSFREVDRPRPVDEGFETGFHRPPPPRNAPPERRGNAGRDPKIVDFVSLVLFVVVWVAAMATKISEQWRLSEKRVILSEADKAQAELSFFKAQINPHFLFNTLNNIYSLAVTKSDHTAPSILKLSEMMRYITEEATEDFVPLDDELNCLKNYIDLQKLRLNHKTKVYFNVEGLTEHLKIAPLILMTFVENAFKFGVSNHIDNEIAIAIMADQNSIRFSCKNSVFDQQTENQRQGIGIANTRKRLDFLYSGRYDLTIEEQEKTFQIDLILESEIS